MHNLWIIIPTYNEIESLPRMVEKLLPIARELPDVENLHVLIVDSNSPDGTGDLAEELARTYPELTVYHQDQKLGLGDAYTKGFIHALHRGATRIIQMDVDGSHRPEDLVPLWKAGKDNLAVVGSRYCPGGKTKGWSKTRLIISKTVSCYGRTMLRIPTRDLNAGFRCWDAHLVEHMLPFLNGHGFVFQAELTNCSYLSGVMPVEVPIVFVERKIGASKANWKIAVEELWRIAKLSIKPPRITTFEETEYVKLLPDEIPSK